MGLQRRGCWGGLGMVEAADEVIRTTEQSAGIHGGKNPWRPFASVINEQTETGADS